MHAGAAATVILFCDAAIHFAQMNIEADKFTCIITDCISLAAHLGLDIYFCRCNVAALCEYPAIMSFMFDAEHPNNWPLVQVFELKFLADLCAAVFVDTCKAVLQAVALIPLSNKPGTLCTLAQLLSYVTHVAKFFTDVSKGTLAKIKNKTLCAALIRNWLQEMKHLIQDSAPAIGETWEKILQRFAEKVQQASSAEVLISALTAPMHISAPLGQDPSQ